MSDISSSSRTQLVDAQITLREEEHQLYTIIFRGLRDSFYKGNISTEVLKSEGREIVSKQRNIGYSLQEIRNYRQDILERLNAEKSKLIAAYQSLLANSFRMAGGGPEPRKQPNRKHSSWKNQIYKYQNSIQRQPPGKKVTAKDKDLWCPITQKYGRHTERKAAHIIPVPMGYENIAWQLGNEGDYALGHDHIWSLKNGAVMSSQLEKALDADVLVIVPIETPKGQPQWLEFVENGFQKSSKAN